MPVGEPKSVIDLENQKIVLRQGTYPKEGSREFVISCDTFVHNVIKRHGIVTEVFQISQITGVTLEMFAHHSGDLFIYGERPKFWGKSLEFNGVDMFVAHAAYTYIVAKRQDDHRNPLKAKISPMLVELKRQLDEGEFDEATLENMRKHNISFIEPKPRTLPSVPDHEIPSHQPPPVISVADELLKLKNLVDAGVITPTEFEREKRRLLG